MKPETIAELLRDGAGADIWYDCATFDDDDSLEKFITDVQLAMNLAANIINPK